MGIAGPHISAEKQEALIRRLAEGGATLNKIALEMDLNPSTVRRYNALLKEAGCIPLLKELRGEEEETPQQRHDAEFWRKRARALEKQLDETQAILAKVSTLHGLRVREPEWTYPSEQPDSRATLIVHTSDWHIGEVVEPGEMNGWNAFNLDIAETRVKRLAQAAVELGARWGEDTRVEGVLLTMGGDAISGDIHEELSRTNEVESLEAVREAVRLYAGLLKTLVDAFGRVHVAAVPGNHGRTTKRPTAKKYGALSYDTFIARGVADQFKADDRVSFHIADGPDALTVLYRYPVLLTHGDKMGTGGGQGFAGPVLPIIRGGHKARLQYGQSGQTPHLILQGHYHTSANPPGVLANGSLVGLNEYGYGLRGAWETPRQWVAMLRERWGLSERLDVQLEQPPLPEKPRVRAVMEPTT